MTVGSPPGILASSPLGRLITEASQLIEEGRYADAIAPLTEAAALNPEIARIQTDLGGLYVELGRHKEALEPLERAIAINPRLAIAHWRLGTVRLALDDINGAVKSFEKAVEIRPALTDAQVHLALLYRDLGRRVDAIQAYRRAAESTDDAAEKLSLEAQALIMEGRDDEAETLLRSALEIAPDAPVVHGLLGQILSSSGRFEEAAQNFEAELAHSPNAGIGYYNLVRSRKMTEDDLGLLERIDTVLAGDGIGSVNRAILLLARAKILDDLGRFEEAMASCNTAAELRSRAFSIDVGAFERRVDRIMEVFDSRAMARARSRIGDPTPVLILGMPRSGTTLVEQIISSHPDASGAGELTYWTNRLDEVLDDPDTGLSGEHLEQAAAEYINGLRTISSTATRVTDKNPFNFLAVGLIHLALPLASIVHCRRNPVDTAISIHQIHFSRTTGMPTGGEDLVRYLRAYQRLMEHWRRVLPSGRMLEIDYEKLAESPNTEIRTLIAHVGLPWDPACLTPHVNSRLVRTPSGWQVRQSINTGSVDRWRRYEPWLGPLAALRDGNGNAS